MGRSSSSSELALAVTTTRQGACTIHGVGVPRRIARDRGLSESLRKRRALDDNRRPFARPGCGLSTIHRGLGVRSAYGVRAMGALLFTPSPGRGERTRGIEIAGSALDPVSV